MLENFHEKICRSFPLPFNNQQCIRANTSYTKVANNGSLLPDSAGRGTNPTDWACTKDNKTSLVWELKTDDNGLRDKDSYYALDSGKGIDGDCKGSKCDVPSYTNAVNAQNLCGIKKWRMPVIEELEGLVFLNTTYFPDTDNRYYFLSSTPNGSGLSYVNFDTGESLQAVRDARLSVRLVGNASDLPIIDKPAPITPPVTTPVIPSIFLVLVYHQHPLRWVILSRLMQHLMQRYQLAILLNLKRLLVSF